MAKARTTPTGPLLAGLSPPVDAELIRVRKFIEKRLRADIEGAFSGAIRMAFDIVLRGMHTGRWSIKELSSTEKTHIGLFVEFEIRELLKCPRGKKLDLFIENLGIEVDVKFSTYMWGWEIPSEAVGRLCLVVHANEDRRMFCVGLLRAHDHMLGAPNKDKKRKLKAAFRDRVEWLVDNGAFRQSFFVDLSEAVRKSIFGTRKGQARVNALLELTAGKIVPRYALATVGLQHDPMRRARGGDGGTKRYLWSKGLIRLGGKYDGDMLNGLGLQPLRFDEYIVVPIAKYPGATARTLIEDYRRANKLA